jgi:hypothetical protein
MFLGIIPIEQSLVSIGWDKKCVVEVHKVKAAQRVPMFETRHRRRKIAYLLCCVACSKPELPHMDQLPYASHYWLKMCLAVKRECAD